MNNLYIKNMVCPRCIKVVSDELKGLGIETNKIELGRVELKEPITSQDKLKIQEVLLNNGFELMDDVKSKHIEKIKILIIEGIRDGKFSEMNMNLSQYISKELHMEYTHLSNLFSSVEGKSIERFVILQKVEKIKELIIYNEFTIKEISNLLGYSSLQALSNQFKKETGMTPTEFKNIKSFAGRKPISEI